MRGNFLCMAEKISLLPELLTPAADDLSVIVDVSENQTKRIQHSNLVGGNNLSWVYLRDKKTQATPGGSTSTGSWLTRDLTEEVYDPDGICALSSNQIVLEEGTYFILASAPGHMVSGHQARLYNVTDSSLLVLGSTEYCHPSYPMITRSLIFGFFQVGASKYLEIQHKCNTARATDGFGPAANLDDEIYTQAVLVKIA